jgi:hypothetical protein
MSAFLKDLISKAKASFNDEPGYNELLLLEEGGGGDESMVRLEVVQRVWTDTEWFRLYAQLMPETGGLVYPLDEKSFFLRANFYHALMNYRGDPPPENTDTLPFQHPSCTMDNVLCHPEEWVLVFSTKSACFQWVKEAMESIWPRQQTRDWESYQFDLFDKEHARRLSQYPTLQNEGWRVLRSPWAIGFYLLAAGVIRPGNGHKRK